MSNAHAEQWKKLWKNKTLKHLKHIVKQSMTNQKNTMRVRGQRSQAAQFSDEKYMLLQTLIGVSLQAWSSG